ncbi:hypothetical protein [Streptomyces sp. NPDC088146]|uniref:hypothetical protein n=1 Tax=Streptomyces sp. NPDC088146 TaxID=3365829 RepID=UPI00382A18A0
MGFATEKAVGVLALGVHGVAGDDHPGQVGHNVQLRLEAGDAGAGGDLEALQTTAQ